MSDVTGPADSLHYRFLGMSFASPIVLLSGCVGFGEEYTRVEGFSNTDCGAVVLKGTTLEPRLGNPPHRVFETPMGMLNAIGLQNPEMSARVVAACRAVTKKPIITKLSPNQTDIKENARLCIEAGSDGLSVINTLMGMAIDARTRRPVIGNVQGGLSGPAIKPIALLKVHQVYDVARKHNVPIIGQGGIVNATDAIEFMIAGASAVGVGTSLFYDPMSCKTINAGIAQYLHEHKLGNVTELIGSLRLG